jgi:microcystin-dependent protein
LPSITGEDELYRSELAVNHYAPEDFVASSAGLFLRVGQESQEDVGDYLIRIGPAYVTDDLLAATEPSIAYSNGTLQEVGQLWFRQTDKAFFVRGTEAWERVTPVLATEEESGIIEVATIEEAIEGVITDAAITPGTLSQWKDYYGLHAPNKTLVTLYVDGYSGDDSVENTGTNPYKPFLSLTRAFIEVAKISYLIGADNDLTEFATVYVAPGEYYVDNRLGGTNYNTLTSLDDDAVGPIQPRVLNGSISALDLSISQFTFDGTLDVYKGDQLFCSSGGKGVIESINGSVVTLRSITGTWTVDSTLTVAELYQFNSIHGGVIVPRGCSVIAQDSAKTIIRPRYVGDLAASLLDSGCGGSSGRSAIFKLTGGSYVKGLTFMDNEVLGTHHLLSAFEFCSATTDLLHAAYGYYRKIHHALKYRTSPEMVFDQIQAVPSEYTIIASAISGTTTDDDGDYTVDSTKSRAPLVDSCNLRSERGLCGIKVEAGQVSGIRAINAVNFNMISLQNLGAAYNTDATAPGGRKIKQGWEHFGVAAIGDCTSTLVNCTTAGQVYGFVAKTGATLRLSSCISEYGQTSMFAWGISTEVIPKDTGAIISNVIPPKPIVSTTMAVPVGILGAALTPTDTDTRLHLLAGFDEESLLPFTLKGGEPIYVNHEDGTEYVGYVTSVPPFISTDTNGSYLHINSGSTIYTAREELNNKPIYIKRSPDTRSREEKIYWLEVTNLSGRRPPIVHQVIRLDLSHHSQQVVSNLFVGLVRNYDNDGVALPAGTAHVALLNYTGAFSDDLEDIWVVTDPDSPEANPVNSATYKAMSTLLTEMGYDASQRATVLTPSDTPSPLFLGNVYPQFHLPSRINSVAHTWTSLGYGSYSSGLPKFQDVDLTPPQILERIKLEKEGGRVYAVGTDEYGHYYQGDYIFDLKTGKEYNGLEEGESSRAVYRKLSVTNRLSLSPNATIDIRSAKVGVDTLTRFDPLISADANYNIYATPNYAGIVELATQEEVDAKLDAKRVVTPNTMTTYVEEYIRSILELLMPVGTIFSWCKISADSSSHPSGYQVIPCDGRLLPIVDYSELYAKIGHTYKNQMAYDETVYFRIPDMVTKALFGAATTGLYAPGAYFGAITYTLTAAQIPSLLNNPLTITTDLTITDPGHSHVPTITEPAHNHTVGWTEVPHNHTLSITELPHKHPFSLRFIHEHQHHFVYDHNHRITIPQYVHKHDIGWSETPHNHSLITAPHDHQFKQQAHNHQLSVATHSLNSLKSGFSDFAEDDNGYYHDFDSFSPRTSSETISAYIDVANVLGHTSINGSGVSSIWSSNDIKPEQTITSTSPTHFIDDSSLTHVTYPVGIDPTVYPNGFWQHASTWENFGALIDWDWFGEANNPGTGWLGDSKVIGSATCGYANSGFTSIITEPTKANIQVTNASSTTGLSITATSTGVADYTNNSQLPISPFQPSLTVLFFIRIK